MYSIETPKFHVHYCARVMIIIIEVKDLTRIMKHKLVVERGLLNNLAAR